MKDTKLKWQLFLPLLIRCAEFDVKYFCSIVTILQEIIIKFEFVVTWTLCQQIIIVFMEKVSDVIVTRFLSVHTALTDKMVSAI